MFELRNLDHVVVDGSGRWNGAASNAYCGVRNGVGDCGGCGIKVTSVAQGDSPSHYVKLRGSTNRNITLRGIDVDGQKSSLGTEGTGLNVGDSTVLSNGSNWIEGLTFENMCIRRVHGEGMYIGANWSDPPQQGLRRITVRNAYVHDTGREGIQLKSLWQGTGANVNRIYGNIVRRSGQRFEEQGQGACFGATGCYTHFYGNFAEDCGTHGIQAAVQNIPPSRIEGQVCPYRAYNNVIWKVGLNPQRSSQGITVNNDVGIVQALEAYNNTIVASQTQAIQAPGSPGSLPASIQNNVAADTEGYSVHESYRQSSNQSGSIASMRFVNPAAGDFRLTTGSPAANSGTTGQFATADYDGVSRPQGGAPDRGAFEFSNSGLPSTAGSGQTVSPPVPPQLF